MKQRFIIALLIVLVAADLAWFSAASAAPGPLRRPPGSSLQSSCPNPYRVRTGDTLANIARRCGATLANLRRWNNLTSSYIRAGQLLVTRSSTGRLSTSGPNTKVFVSGRALPTPTPCIEPPIPP